MVPVVDADSQLIQLLNQVLSLNCNLNQKQRCARVQAFLSLKVIDIKQLEHINLNDINTILSLLLQLIKKFNYNCNYSFFIRMHLLLWNEKFDITDQFFYQFNKLCQRIY